MCTCKSSFSNNNDLTDQIFNIILKFSTLNLAEKLVLRRNFIEKQRISNIIDLLKEEIPKGWFLGLSETHINLLCYVLNKIVVNNNSNHYVLDIGSGKGYIDRILSNHYKIKTFCVDSTIERLISNVRLNRLLKDDDIKNFNSKMINNNEKSINKRYNNINPNMEIFQCHLQNIHDFEKIWIKSIQFFDNDNKDNNDVSTITILGLKVCGDMFYDIVEWVFNYTIMNNKSENIKLLIVPCCLHLCKQFPKSTEISTNYNDSNVEQTDLNVLSDMLLWVSKLFDDKGVVELSHCIGSSYYSIEIDVIIK